MFVLSPQVGPPYFPFVFVLGYINPSCSDPRPLPPPPLWIAAFCVSVDILLVFPQREATGRVKIVPTFSQNMSDLLNFFSLRLQKTSVPCLLGVSVFLMSAGASVLPLHPWLLFKCCSDHFHKECGELKPLFSRTDPTDCTDVTLFFHCFSTIK